MAELEQTEIASELEALASLLGEGVLVVEDGSIVFASEAAAAMCGREDSARLLGAAPEAVFDATPAALTASADGAPLRCGVRGIGAHRCLELRSRELAPGRRLYALRDTGELDRARENLLETSGDLQRAQQEVAQLSARLDSEVQERHELIAVVSHELRTPITVIQGYTKLLLSEQVGPLEDEQRRFLEELQRSCDRLNGFVGMLLDATRAERAAECGIRGGVDARVDASVAPLLGSVVEFLKPLTLDAGVRIELELDPEAGCAHFDAVQVEQVVTNLLGNAIKYSDAGSCIRVRTSTHREGADAFVMVSVCDEGPGIDPDEREAIFEAYVRGASSARAQGIGLGLAICKRIVKSHGGRIGVGCPETGGSRFWFTLPAAHPKQDTEPAAVRAAGAGGS